MASHHPGATTAPDPHLAPPILATWLSVFRPCFTAPVWNRILVLVAGAVLAPGKRTVTQVLRVMGLADEPSFRRYHEVLSRARWDGQAVARVLFNTNCTLIQPKRFQELIDTGLDELRVSLDAADRGSYAKIRGKDFFNRIVRDVGKFVAHQKQVGATKPRVSLWLTGLKETIDQLPEFVRLAAQMGVTEVHLQRLVFDQIGYGKATAGNSLFESAQEAERRAIEAAQEIALPLEVTLAASGATEPELSLKRQDKRAWAACRRPWSLMYFTAHGRALPCCIAPFSMRGYSNYTLGDATQQELREIWNSAAYRDFRTGLLSDAPPAPCQNCGMRWSL